MTREEAFEKLMAGTRNSCTEGQMLDFRDMVEALDIIKFDEPKSLKSKTLDALFKQFGGHDIETILGLLDDAGLKVVEK